MSGQQGYIIEFQRIGNVVKVSAMDPASLTEVSIVGDPSAGEVELSRLAVRKLEFVMARRAAGHTTARTTGGGND